MWYPGWDPKQKKRHEMKTKHELQLVIMCQCQFILAYAPLHKMLAKEEADLKLFYSKKFLDFCNSIIESPIH